jgi:hypothetical protein
MSGPTIRAEFELDEQGQPRVIKPPCGGHLHYLIRLSVANVPDDTVGVTYHLHASFSDPTRNVGRNVEDFAEEITSYGDFDLGVTVRRKSGNELVVTSLSSALREFYGAGAAPGILRAIKEIEKN